MGELLTAINAYEKKLEELMSPEDYANFMREVASTVIVDSIDSLNDSEFKTFMCNVVSRLFADKEEA